MVGGFMDHIVRSAIARAQSEMKSKPVLGRVFGKQILLVWIG